jgi:hypothetical protein
MKPLLNRIDDMPLALYLSLIFNKIINPIIQKYNIKNYLFDEAMNKLPKIEKKKRLCKDDLNILFKDDGCIYYQPIKYKVCHNKFLLNYDHCRFRPMVLKVFPEAEILNEINFIIMQNSKRTLNKGLK